MANEKTKIYFFIQIFTLLFILSTYTGLFGKEIPDRKSIYKEFTNEPVSDRFPVIMTKFLPMETSKSTQLTETGSFSDLLISESVSPATFYQRSSTIAKLSDGRTAVGWTDDRNGNKMIFIQIFDADGNRAGSNITAIGRDDRYDITYPKLVSDGFGGFYLGWRDNATGSLYVSRFDNELNKQAEFRISNPALGYAGLYDLALYPGGKLAAVWEQFSTTNSINFRIFSNSGTPLTGNVTINKDGGGSTYRAPSIAVEPSGNSAVTWEDYRNGNADIYVQFINSDGSLYGANQRIIDFDYLAADQYLPEIAFSPLDGYIISWLDKRSGTQRVYLQRIIRAGLIGSNVNISDNAASYTDWYISMAVNSSGHLVVAWASVDGIDKILLREFSAGVIPDDTVITVSAFPTGNSWETAIEFDNVDNLYCTWSDSRRGNWDILLKQYDSDTSPLSEDITIVNDDTEGAHSTQPVVSRRVDPIYGYGIIFTDTRNDVGDIYARTVLPDGQFQSDETKVNKDDVPSLQKDPYIIHSRRPDAGSESTVNDLVWVDSRAIDGIIGQRIFINSFTYIEDIQALREIIVSDTLSITPKSYPKIIDSYHTPMLIAWIDYANGDGQIYSRIWNSFNNPSNWFDVTAISQVGVETDNFYINLMVQDGYTLEETIFTIAWLSRGIDNGPLVIFAQYDTFGDPLNKFNFTSDQTGQAISEISAVSNANGDIYILWTGKGAVNYLYLTVFDNTGNIIHPTYEITGGIGGVKEGIDIAIDIHGAVIATWVDDRNGRDEVFYQVFYPDLTPSGPNKPVSPTEQRYMMSPTVAMDGQQAAIAWVDPRANGNNVYMSQIDYHLTDIDNTEPGTIPTGYSLEQNYPNPFNPNTSIQFVLPTKSRVKLEVYNLLGQKIATITDKIFESGKYTVNWDGTNSTGTKAASGIYFYRIEAGDFEQTRKMILLK